MEKNCFKLPRILNGKKLLEISEKIALNYPEF